MRLFFGVLSAAVLLAAPLTASAADDTAAALLLKHKAFVGWQAGDGSFTTLTYTGDMSSDRDGKAYAQVREIRKGLAFRETTKQIEHGTVENDGFTGRVFWQSNRNGFTHPVRGDAEKYAISEELVFNEGLSELPGTLQGNDTVAGVACTVVQVRADASFPVNVCIDPQTGAL